MSWPVPMLTYVPSWCEQGWLYLLGDIESNREEISADRTCFLLLFDKASVRSDASELNARQHSSVSQK